MLLPLLTKILSAVKEGQQKYCETVYSRRGRNHMWILKNSKDLLDNPQGKQLGRFKNRTPARFEYIYYIAHIFVKLTVFCCLFVQMREEYIITFIQHFLNSIV